MSSPDIDALQTDRTSDANYLELVCHRCRRTVHVLYEGTAPALDTEFTENVDSSSPNSSPPGSLTWRELLRAENEMEETNNNSQQSSPEQSPSNTSPLTPMTLPAAANSLSLSSIFKRNTLSLSKVTEPKVVNNTNGTINSPKAPTRNTSSMPIWRQKQLRRQQEEYEAWRKKNKAFLTKLCRYAFDEGRLDHFLCLECGELVLIKLHTDHAQLTEEQAQYEEFLSQMSTDDGNEEDFLQEMHKLEEEEGAIREDLTAALSEERELKRIDKEWTTSMQERQQQEDRYWTEFNQFQLQHQLFEQERDALQKKIAHVSRELDRLNSANVFNDAFHIWYEGHFGTINNFRLGKLPTQNVEWNEINAAWGQAALLLYTLARYKQFTFSRYRIIPMGSFSKIEVTDGVTNVYELYGGGGALFWSSRFDKAMVSFLQCIKELADDIAKKDASFELPYK